MNIERTKELDDAIWAEETPLDDVCGNQDGPIIEAKRKRARAKGALTRQMGIIDKLTSNAKNLAQVKEKMNVYSESVSVFEIAHLELLELLLDEDEREEAKVYMMEVMIRHKDFEDALFNWIASQEEVCSEPHMDIEVEDRLENAVPRKGEMVFREILDACFEAENNGLSEEIKELSRMQQLELQNRQLLIQKEKQKFELEKAKIESELMLKKERHRLMEELNKLKEEVNSNQTTGQLQSEGFGLITHSAIPKSTPGRPEVTSEVPRLESTPREPQKIFSRVSWEPSNVAENDSEKKAACILADALSQVLDLSRTQQQSVVESLQVPRGEIPSFSGDALEYWPFIRSFKDTVGCLSIPAAQKLACLGKYCKGKAALALKSAYYKSPEEGYIRALQILEERFGNPYTITCEWVKKVTNRPDVKGSLDLREYADELTCCLESLKEMNSLSQLASGDNMLKIVEKLPYYLQTRWVKVNYDIRSKYKRGPDITELVKFICDVADETSDPVFGKLVSRDQRKQREKGKSPMGKNLKMHSKSFAVNTSITKDTQYPETGKQAGGKCPCCGEKHYIIRCSQFKAMKVKDRWNLVKSKGLCVNCFALGHIGKNCSRNFVCHVEGCGRKHSKYLHLSSKTTDASANSQESPLQAPVPVSQVSVASTPLINDSPLNTSVSRVSNFACRQGGRLALPIVPARVRCLDTNVVVDTYALLDPGTNTTYCTEDLHEKLGTRGVTRHLELTTIAQTRMPVESTVITLLVSDLDDKQEPFCIQEVAVRPTLNLDLSGLSSQLDIEKWPHLKNLRLPKLEVDQVHLLVGQDCAGLLLPDEIKKGQPGEPFAIHTPLGWAINGPIDPFKPSVRSSHFIHSSSVMEKDLVKLWELEGVNCETPGRSQSDLKVLEIWDKNKSLIDNHYTLNIPFKAERPCLPDNRTMAEKRLQMLGRRLERDDNLKERYTKEIKELLEKGYAELVPQEEMSRADGKVWYLPHHPVHNPKKPDKTRIVFDCAAKFGKLSLNDHVWQGPDLANKLVGVLLRFRQGAIAFIADIEAMFLQVRVPPDDRDVLRFLWFQDDNVGGQILTYRMTSHLFGGVWSPSCANYALQQVTKEFNDEFPQAVLDTVLYNFYVDDCLKSVKTLETAVTITDLVIQLLARRGFSLTKFVSNSPELMTCIPRDKWGKSFSILDVSMGKLPTERALGMLWDIESDCFRFDIQMKDKPRTKRGVLSTLSTVYDPLGCVSPFVLQARRLFQQLCKMGKGWDESLPRDLEEQWGRWLNDLPIIGEFRIPRCIAPKDKLIKTAQLHHFCDASEYGYGAISYLLIVFEDETVYAHLMMAKSRLAPLKGSTIPRLELAGALEAVRLDKLLQEELEIILEESIFWTDSTIVLWYLQSTAKRFQIYVANRVAKILEHTTPIQWRYVPTTENPGDDASRGMTAHELVNDERWVRGPSFLYQSRNNWPRQPALNCAELEKMAEVKSSPVVYAINTQDDHTCRLLSYYSSWHRLKKAVAWFLRLRQILRKKPCQRGPLVVDEMKIAEEAVIRFTQKKMLDKDISKLNPKKSASGLLLVGGRLTKSNLEDCAKHQFILPSDHPVSKLIIEDYHRRAKHAGVERVLADTRRRYWIVKGRKLVKKIVHQCVICRKLRGKTEIQQMASLPEARVMPSEPPFSRVGVDYFGPFTVKRARSDVKRYGCIFTCLAIRAIHIEVAHSLSTDSFINAMERFMARRGEPKEIWSDNGTNFVGAQQELRRAIEDWNQSQIHEHLLKKEVAWKFNPPGASHMGGVWERQIRTVRSVLAGMMKQQDMDDETLVTLLTIVEGIVNNRPITKLSDDPRDERPLTPNHLLMLRGGPVLPLGKFDQRDAYRRKWKQAQYLADVFWHRWLREYLHTLQERQKWMKPRPNLNMGDLVLMKQDNMSRNQWPIGLVTGTHKSDDGLVRCVDVRTATGTYERPVTKICVLESAIIEEN